MSSTETHESALPPILKEAQSIWDRRPYIDIVIVYRSDECARFRRRHGIAKKTEDASRPEWVSDFDKVPNAHIIPFCFDMSDDALSYLSHSFDVQSNTLLNYLQDKRGFRMKNRPLVFVAHSLGGILVKSALVQATSADDKWKSIYLATKMVIFCDTPHQSTEYEQNIWHNFILQTIASESKLPEVDIEEKIRNHAFTMRLQAERYKSIEMKHIQNICWRGLPQTTLNSSSIPKDASRITLVRRPGWKILPGSLSTENLHTFSSEDNRQSRQKLIEYVSEIADDALLRSSVHVVVRRKLTKNTDLSLKAWGEGDYQRMIIRAEQDGLISIDTLNLLNQYAKKLSECKDDENARMIHQRIYVAIEQNWLETPESLDAPICEDLVSYLVDAAKHAEYLGRFEEGLKRLDSSLVLQEKVIGPNSASMCELHSRKAKLHGSAGQTKEASQSYRLAIKIAKWHNKGDVISRLEKEKAMLNLADSESNESWNQVVEYLLLAGTVALLSLLLTTGLDVTTVHRIKKWLSRKSYLDTL